MENKIEVTQYLEDFKPYLEFLKGFLDYGDQSAVYVTTRLEPYLKKLTLEEITEITDSINEAINKLKKNKDYKIYGIILDEFYFSPEVDRDYDNLAAILRRDYQEFKRKGGIPRSILGALKRGALNTLTRENHRFIRNKIDSILSKHSIPLQEELKRRGAKKHNSTFFLPRR